MKDIWRKKLGDLTLDDLAKFADIHLTYDFWNEAIDEDDFKNLPELLADIAKAIKNGCEMIANAIIHKSKSE